MTPPFGYYAPDDLENVVAIYKRLADLEVLQEIETMKNESVLSVKHRPELQRLQKQLANLRLRELHRKMEIQYEAWVHLPIVPEEKSDDTIEDDFVLSTSDEADSSSDETLRLDITSGFLLEEDFE